MYLKEELTSSDMRQEKTQNMIKRDLEWSYLC